MTYQIKWLNKDEWEPIGYNELYRMVQRHYPQPQALIELITDKPWAMTGNWSVRVLK